MPKTRHYKTMTIKIASMKMVLYANKLKKVEDCKPEAGS